MDEIRVKYVLVTAARNEDNYIEKTIESIIRQTVLPSKWIIVSDGSTDGTEKIVARYEKDYNFISLISASGDLKRNFGSQVRAINAAVSILKNSNEKFDFIGNLDADISLEYDYYEKILNKFNEEPDLGLAGGYIYELNRGSWNIRPFNSVDSVPHAIQLFRAQAFIEIGGYPLLKYGGPDWYAEVAARMNGWNVRTFQEIKVFHNRPTLGMEGSIRGAFRQGLMDHSLGSHPVFEFIKCAKRVTGKPYVLYSISRLSGFLWAYIKREDRTVKGEFIDALRLEQLKRVKELFWK